MTRIVLASLASALLLVATSVRAEEHPEMDAARQALESARSNLQAAGHDYAGHRVKALERVNQALEQIRLGVAASAGPERRIERREGRLERRDQRIDQRLEAIKKRRQEQER